MPILHRDPELIHTLEKQSKFVPCDQDRILFREGDATAGLYILEKGIATLSKNLMGREIVVALQDTPGSLVGLPDIVGTAPHTVAATVLSGARLRLVARDDFNAIMGSDPLLFLKILQILAAEVRFTRRAVLHQLRSNWEGSWLQASSVPFISPPPRRLQRNDGSYGMSAAATK